jgi:DNA-binding protein YbaB
MSSTSSGEHPGATPGPIDAAQLRNRQVAARERIAAVQARALQAKATLESETTSATSPDRSVTVTVNAAGTLVDLTFGQSAGKLPHPTLARTVLATHRQATVEAVGRTEALMRDLVGDEAPVLDIIRASAPDLQEEPS